MPKYEIDVWETFYRTAKMLVEADSEEEAHNLAMSKMEKGKAVLYNHSRLEDYDFGINHIREYGK